MLYGILPPVNICSISKIALVATAFVIVAGGAKPQQAFGSNTGTLPVIVGPGANIQSIGPKDTGSIPIIINPSNPNPTGDGSGHLEDQQYTVTIGISNVTTDDQLITLTSSNTDIIQIDPSATVPTGSSSATATFTLPYSFHHHHKEVHLTATCNGQSVECIVKVHYHNEED